MTDQTFHGIPVVTDTAVPPGAAILAAPGALAAAREYVDATITRDQAHARVNLAPRPPYKFGPEVTIDRDTVEHARPAILDTLAVYRAHVEHADRAIVRRIIAEAHTAGLPDDVAVEVQTFEPIGVRVRLTQHHHDATRGLTFDVDTTEVQRITARMYPAEAAEAAACQHVGTLAARAWARRHPEETTA